VVVKENLIKVIGDLDLIMAMGKEGLEVKWSKIKIWTLGNKAKRACKNSEEVKFRNSKEIQMQSLESQKPGCHKPTPLREISSSRFGCSGNK
jgi:hypothetical protein